MRNIKLTLQFDGTDYHGWQIQKADRTIQKTVQDAVSTIVDSEVKLHGSGRTDAGVHALGQVANFKTASRIDTDTLKKGLNSLLPDDIVIVDAQEADLEFHSRFSAKSRVYWYFIWTAPVASPFYSRYAWHIFHPLDVAQMRAAAQSLLGVHDFSSFQGADREAVNPVREVTRIRFKKAGRHLLLFEVQALSFLKHMVRNIIGTLADVGRGKQPPAWIHDVLMEKNRIFAGVTAPPQGLFLKEVRY